MGTTTQIIRTAARILDATIEPYSCKRYEACGPSSPRSGLSAICIIAKILVVSTGLAIVNGNNNASAFNATVITPKNPLS